MLTQSDIPALLSGKLPIGPSIQELTEYTKRMALEHDFKSVKRSISLVEKLYARGNAPIRNAVENIFIFSFSSIMSRCNIVEWRIVQSYMPSELYAVYIRQVIARP